VIDRRQQQLRGRLALLAVVAGLICAAASIPVLLPQPTSEAAGITGLPPPASRSSEGGLAVVGSVPAAPSSPSAVGPPDLTDPTPDAGPVLLGSWTVIYDVGAENGDGANIEIPLRRLDGLVIPPGGTFDFWTAVGEVSRRTGYRSGGVIVGDHLDPDGALAGGICTVSTAIFNAAARAGLRIVSRTSHSGYLAKYPLGLDAAGLEERPVAPDDGVPQRHTGSDRRPDSQHAGHRPGRPVRGGCPGTARHLQYARDQSSAARG
jgi:hypothetical protein